MHAARAPQRADLSGLQASLRSLLHGAAPCLLRRARIPIEPRRGPRVLLDPSPNPTATHAAGGPPSGAGRVAAGPEEGVRRHAVRCSSNARSSRSVRAHHRCDHEHERTGGGRGDARGAGPGGARARPPGRGGVGGLALRPDAVQRPGRHRGRCRWQVRGALRRQGLVSRRALRGALRRARSVRVRLHLAGHSLHLLRRRRHGGLREPAPPRDRGAAAASRCGSHRGAPELLPVRLAAARG